MDNWHFQNRDGFLCPCCRPMRMGHPPQVWPSPDVTPTVGIRSIRGKKYIYAARNESSALGKVSLPRPRTARTLAWTVVQVPGEGETKQAKQ